MWLAIDAERAERVQAIIEVQNQISELREEFCVFVSNSSRPTRGDKRTDSRNEEIEIGGFGLKSKDGAIRIVEKVIAGNNGNSTIMEDRVSMVPKVIPVKFNLRTHGGDLNVMIGRSWSGDSDYIGPYGVGRRNTRRTYLTSRTNLHNSSSWDQFSLYLW